MRCRSVHKAASIKTRLVKFSVKEFGRRAQSLDLNRSERYWEESECWLLARRFIILSYISVWPHKCYFSGTGIHFPLTLLKTLWKAVPVATKEMGVGLSNSILIMVSVWDVQKVYILYVDRCPLMFGQKNITFNDIFWHPGSPLNHVAA